ncbi:unnamed protein product, partial [Nesidiocoris tenuis]
SSKSCPAPETRFCSMRNQLTVVAFVYNMKSPPGHEKTHRMASQPGIGRQHVNTAPLLQGTHTLG